MPRTLINTVGIVCFACIAAAVPLVTFAAGTARIQLSDGDVKIYKNVRIAIEHKQMRLTSADGVGTFIISRAGCSEVDKLVRCYPYDAVLNQHGRSIPITIVEGTAWMNPGSSSVQLPHSATRLQPRGVMMSFRTKRGSYVSLTGVADVLTK